MNRIRHQLRGWLAGKTNMCFRKNVFNSVSYRKNKKKLKYHYIKYKYKYHSSCFVVITCVKRLLFLFLLSNMTTSPFMTETLL